jgi:hypothetical protein
MPTDLPITLPPGAVCYVALHQPGRGSEPPCVFIDIASIKAVFPEGACAGIMLKDVPAPLKVHETSRDVIRAVYEAVGEAPPEHLGLEGGGRGGSGLKLAEN